MVNEHLPFQGPRTKDGHEIDIGTFVKWTAAGQEHMGRVRAFSAFGDISVVEVKRGIPKGYDLKSDQVEFLYRGW